METFHTLYIRETGLPGFSTFIISAPKSPRSIVVNGPARILSAKQKQVFKYFYWYLFFKFTIFSRLNAPSIYFKLGPTDPAFIRTRHLIRAWHLLMRCFFFCHFIKSIYYHPNSETQQSWSRQDDFSLHSV